MAVTLTVQDDRSPGRVHFIIEAWDGKERVGFLCYDEDRGLGEIQSIFVIESRRREGIATQMVAEIRKRRPNVMASRFNVVGFEARQLREAIWSDYATPAGTPRWPADADVPPGPPVVIPPITSAPIPSGPLVLVESTDSEGNTRKEVKQDGTD